MTHVLVSTGEQLKRASDDLAGAATYYIDTEFEKTRKVSQLCLIQVSTGAAIYLVDTIRLKALDSLSAVLARPEAEWVFHAGGEDLLFLEDRLRIDTLPRIYDTQVAWGLLGPEYPVSLAYLLYRVLGKKSRKAQQADDWTRRPLPERQLNYAAADVVDLPAIKEALDARLAEVGRKEIVHVASREAVTPTPKEPLSLRDFRNLWQLDAAGYAALRYIVKWFNTLTEHDRDFGPVPRVLFEIARLLPKSTDELAKIKGVHFKWARRHGNRLTAEIAKLSANGDGPSEAPPEPPPYDSFDRILAEGRLRRACAEVSAELRMAPALAFPGRLMRAMIDAILDEGKPLAAAEVPDDWRGPLLREPLRERLKA